VLWLAREAGMPLDELADGLEHRSGLARLGGTDDMRAILSGASQGGSREQLALEVFLHRLRSSIAAMAASLAGIDTLVFTGGIGERSAPVRAMTADGLGFLGVAIDPGANEAAATADTEITARGGMVRSFVIPAREDVEIAREVRAALGVDRGG